MATPTPDPTKRELAILKALWLLGEGSVRQVHEALPADVPIVQNTVQAFLRTMEEKGLVTHRVDGRSFIYSPAQPRDGTGRRLLSNLLDRVFDGAVDELVESALTLRRPTETELERLRALVDRFEQDEPQEDTP